MTRYRRVDAPFFVTTGLDPVVHTDTRRTNAAIYLMLGRWIAGSSPAMTTRKIVLATRLHPSSAKPFPRFASASAEPRGAERRKAQWSSGPRHANRCCHLRARGRGSALIAARSPIGASPRRLSRRPNARNQPRPRFTRAGGRRRYPCRQSKRRTPRAGRHAGGDDARTARERGYKPHPQEPHSLRNQAS